VLQVITGLPDAPAVAYEVPLSAIERMAVSDDGAIVLAAAAGGLSPILVAGSVMLRDLPLTGPLTAMAFRRRSHDALVASADRLTLVRDLNGETTYQVFNDWPGAPVDVAFSASGQRLFAAYAEGTVRTRDLFAGDSRAVSCDCAPKGLYPMNGDSVFRLNDSDEGPMFLLDGATNRILFIGGGNQ
jgi:hypothetical protein